MRKRAIGSTSSGTDGRLDGYRYLHSTRADLLRRLGRHAEAADAYRAALALTANATEQEFLTDRIVGLRVDPSPDG